MSLNELSVREFTEALAAKSSVPGGGGATALVAAIGAALGAMVGNYTVGKKKYAAVEPDIIRLMDEAERLRKELLSCIDEDAVVFEPLSRAYAIPKGTPGRDEIMEKCLRDAAAVPMKILELSCRGILLHRELAEKGSTIIISDAGTGAVLCWAAMYASALSVKANTMFMSDREYAESMNTRIAELMGAHWEIAEETYESVMRRLL